MGSKYMPYISATPWEFDSIAKKPMWFPIGTMIHEKDTDKYFQMMVISGEKTWVRIMYR